MIVISSDHRGVELKREVLSWLREKKYAVEDLGPQSGDSVDYPDYALKVAQSVASGKAEKGIVICHSGIGVSVSANKVKGIRAALCQTAEQAELSRKHTDANVLSLPAGFVSKELAKQIVEIFLQTGFEGGRHADRLSKIKNIEDGK